MDTVPLISANPILFRAGLPGLRLSARRLPGAVARLAIPTQPVGDPVPRPSTPQPGSPQRDPDEPVHAPHPREPELPAIDPHEPGLPDTRIGNVSSQMCIGDPSRSASVPCWLI